MKRGVVVKQSRRSTIVLTSEGTFLEISMQEQAEIGQEVEFSAQELVRRTRIRHWTPSMKNFMRVAVLVLVFVLALFPVYSWYNGNKAYAYVSLDFNPSIELKVNNRMDVVSVAALNEDAEKVLAALDDWQGEPVEQVAAGILRKSSDLGLLTDSESIIIGVNYIDTKQEDKQLTSILEGSVNTFNNTLHIASFQVPDKVRQTAQDEHKSMNEIMAQTILEGNSSKSDSALSQSDSAIIKDFYKEDVKEQGAEQDETSQRTKDGIDAKPASVVVKQSVKEREETDIDLADKPSGPEEANQSKEAKKQMKEEKKQAKETEKQARKAERKQEKANGKSDAAEKEREVDKHNMGDMKSHNNPDENKPRGREKEKAYGHDKQDNKKKPTPPGHEDRRNEDDKDKKAASEKN
ncbi:anti-sigma factor domain-containing protein [Terribacillus sp. 179-K 1B1 HS]|uniref:anti-sigma factor domain-containing protein n=1 Tax=Terribacillus sp. 179-K 1B1 HS TaxID=3142388 RepID=UPI0039A22732